MEVYWDTVGLGNIIPKRATTNSAAYDLTTPQAVVLPPDEITMVGTGLSAKLAPRQCLIILPRSSHPKKGLYVANSPGLIDSDYYPNEIKILLRNDSGAPMHIAAGERIAQALLTIFQTFENERPPEMERTGGFGSTG